MRDQHTHRTMVSSLSAKPHCFATMFLLTQAPTQQGRSWETEKALFRVFTARLLNFTQLPLHVLHNAEAAPRDALAGISAVGAQMHYHQVDMIHGHTSGFDRHYAHMYTKLHAWRVLAPLCGTVALVDYDVLTLRSPDGIFDACGGAPLCAVRTNRNVSYFNGGLLVFPPDEATFARMKRTVATERERGRRRDDAEQGLLNEWYPTWKSLPVEYNVQGVAAGAPWNQDTTVFLHEKYWLLPPKLQMRLLPRGEGRARPTLLGHLRSLVTHLLATIGLLHK